MDSWILIYHFVRNRPKSLLFLQKCKVVVYNSSFSHFVYLQRRTKIYENAIFNHFLSFLEIRAKESLDSWLFFRSSSIRFLESLDIIPLYCVMPIRNNYLFIINLAIFAFSSLAAPCELWYFIYFLFAYLLSDSWNHSSRDLFFF